MKTLTLLLILSCSLVFGQKKNTSINAYSIGNSVGFTGSYEVDMWSPGISEMLGCKSCGTIKMFIPAYVSTGYTDTPKANKYHRENFNHTHKKWLYAKSPKEGVTGKPFYELKPNKPKDTISRYWLYEASFKVDSGCSNTCHGTFEKLNAEPCNFDDVKYNVAKYVYPNKVVSLTVKSITEIEKSAMLTKSDTFKCKPYHDIWVDLGKSDTSAKLNNVHFYTIDQIHVDTITVLTYCMNVKNLKAKWFMLKAIKNYQTVNFYNYFIIYSKYLDVPKKYKAIYSLFN